MLDKIKNSESTVLVQGENGTGKELIARAIHFNSPRKDAQFVTVNCSAFNENLLDSELFGHVKGSFTGAIKDKKGLFEAADKGTLFLDEIGDMSPTMQVKLLRVLQQGTLTPVGGTEVRKVDVRVVAATNKDLKDMVETGHVPRRSLLPHQRDQSRGSAASRSQGRHPGSCRSLYRARLQRKEASRSRTSPSARWKRFSITRGQATSASSRTKSNA